jgi:hypothetical protein
VFRLTPALSSARSALAIAVTLALAGAGAVASVAASADARPVVQSSPVAASEVVAPLVPTTGAIEGTVKSAKGVALVGAGVSAWSYSEEEGWADEPSFTTESTTDGAYSLAVAPGTYIVKFTAPALAQPLYIDEYWKNATEPWYAMELTVAEGETVTKINASLDATSFVTGKVTKSGGAALTTIELAGISLSVCSGESFDDEFYLYDDCIGTSTIAADGSYTISGFGAGDYTVYLTSTGDFLNSYYPSAQYPSEANSFTVKPGATAKNKNFTVTTGASITGTLSTSLNYLSGASITAYLEDTEEQCCEEEYEPQSKTVTSDATGHYSIGGLWPGDYTLFAHDAAYNSTTYSGEWFDNTYTQSQARVLTLADLTSTAGADVQLEPSSSFRGNVVIKNSPNAAVGALVELYRFTSTKNKYTELEGSRVVGADGTFSFGPVTPGRYVISIGSSEVNSSYTPLYWGAPAGGTIHEATIVNLASGGGLEFTLQAVVGGIYTGTVVGTDGPIEGVYVIAETDSTDGEGGYSVAVTDAAGQFELGGLASGAYTITVDPSELGSDDDGEDTGIHYVQKRIVAPPVTEGSLATDLGTIALEAGSVLKGVVSGPNGKPVRYAGLTAEVRDVDGDLQWVDYADTDSKGRYAFTSLPTGDLYISIESSYPAQYIGGTNDSDMTTPIVITTPGSTRTQDITLFAGGSISGTVRDATTGRVIPNVLVTNAKVTPGYSSWYSESDPENPTLTSKKGKYVIPGLTPGSYELGFTDYPTLKGTAYVTGHATTYLADAKGVSKNISLSRGTKISGTVTSGGEPASFVVVAAYSFDDEAFDPLTAVMGDVAFGITDEDGTYSFAAAPGTYIVQFIDFANDLSISYLGGASTPEESTPLVVSTTALTGISHEMPTFSGSITATLTGDYDETASATVILERSPVGGGDPIHTTYWSEDSIDDAFPITNLTDGVYTYRVVASDNSGYLDGAEGTFTIDADHHDVDLGEIDLGAHHEFEYLESGNTGARPAVSSTEPRVGDVLTVDEGGWTDDVEGFEYQWLRNGKPIVGAFADTYVVAPGDAEKRLSVRVLGLDSSGSPVEFSGTRTDETDAVRAGAAPIPLSAPVVAGTTRVGKTLSVSTGEWDLPGLSYSYSWIRTSDGVSQVVGSKSSYTLTTKDVAATLTVEVTASRRGFDSETIPVPVAAVQPSTALTQTKKSVLSTTETGYSVTPGTWTPKPASVTYQWQLGGVAVEGATAATFAPAMPGQVSVIVTAAKSGYASTSVEVLASPLEWSSAPTASSGPNQVGYPLTVDLSSATTTPAATGYTIQWMRDAKAIKGATKTTYVPTLAGGVITAVVTGVRGSATTSEPRIVDFGTTLPAGGAFTANVELDTDAATVGRPVLATISDLALTGTKTVWQWYRQSGDDDPMVIAKATKASYTPTAADLGYLLSATATVTRAGYETNVAHAETGIITLTPAAALTQPTLPRDVSVGAPVKAAPGTWNLSGVTYTYRWLLNGYEIPGATASTYTPRAEDADEELSVEVTAIKPGFPSSTAATSAAVTIGLGAAPKATKVPVVSVSGKAVTTVTGGKVLTSTLGTWTTPGTVRALRWEASPDGVGWETVQADGNASFTVHSGLEPGTKLRVVVTATKAGYQSGIAYSKVVTVK